MSIGRVLFHGKFGSVTYILREDGLHVNGANINGSTVTAIKERISRLYADGLSPEQKNFDSHLNYIELFNVLNMPVHTAG